MNYGFRPDDILPEHWKQGDGNLGATPLQPNGDWSAFLPFADIQNSNGYEVYDCVSEGTLHAVQTLLNRQYNDKDDYSPRYLATISGTQYQNGNSPHTVAEFMRREGCALEVEWPYQAATFQEFYTMPPSDVQQKAKAFVAHFTLNHDWVNTDLASLKDALQYSPLGVSVYAWVQQQTDGRYIRPAGVQDNHFVMLYGYEDGVCWKVFDSYDNTHKELVWDFGFGQAKRYALSIAAPEQSLLNTLKQALLAALAYLSSLATKQPVIAPQEPLQQPKQPEPTPQPSQLQTASLDAFCLAIRDYEGKPGDLNYRNNNPGNCRCSQVGYAPVYGTVLCVGGFAKFSTMALGMLYLKNRVREKIKQHPSWTIYDYFADPKEGHAPASDGNNPTAYANHVAKQIGVTSSFLIKNLA